MNITRYYSYPGLLAHISDPEYSRIKNFEQNGSQSVCVTIKVILA